MCQTSQFRQTSSPKNVKISKQEQKKRDRNRQYKKAKTMEKQVIETWAFRRLMIKSCKADALPLSHIPLLPLTGDC
jgi:hypothetical protein